MRYYVAKYFDNGKVKYWSGRGTMFTEKRNNAAKFDLSNAIQYANQFDGFLEAA